LSSKPRELALTARDIDDIQLFHAIAREHGTDLSLSEVLSLLRSDFSEEEAALVLSSSNDLKDLFQLHDGSILPRNSNGEGFGGKSKEWEKRRRAERNLGFAFMFADFSHDDLARLLSVSGSSSYGSVPAWGDLDFFCIARRDTLWLFITRLLILTRVFRAIHRDTPILCLSCMMDESYAKRTFHRIRDPLFARDALNISIIRGQDFYDKLLRETTWISDYYPQLYQQRISANKLYSEPETHENAHPALKTANQFLYCLVGSYLRLKAYLLNRRLTKDGKDSLVFAAKIGTDHCIYESVRYSRLRRLYSRLGGRRETDAISIQNQ
jgi:hypothetical protein